MPSIELEGHSEAKFALIDGKIVRVEAPTGAPSMPSPSFDTRLRE